MEPNCKTSTKPKSVKEFFKSWYFWKPVLGIIIGGAGGFLFFHFVKYTSVTTFFTFTS